MELKEKTVVNVSGWTDNSCTRQSASSGFFKIALISIFSLADAGIGCGGSEDEDDGPTEDIEVVAIPAGSFVLSHETSLHNSGDTVTLNAFELKKTPVTVAEFEKCVTAGKCSSEHYRTNASAEDYSYRYCNYARGDDWLNHPMNCIDWDGAKEYCKWVGGRLPTEEEWEYAATHNGTVHLDTMYPWGNAEPVHCQTANYGALGSTVYCNGKTESARFGTSAVGTYSPAGDSPLGLVDMAGNVWEWTASESTASSGFYITKGGSWLYGEWYMSAPYRDWNSSIRLSPENGFRCAK